MGGAEIKLKFYNMCLCRSREEVILQKIHLFTFFF